MAAVTTPDGVPFDQLRVDLYDARTVALMASQVTDGTGWFRFVDLNRGFSKVKVDLTCAHGHLQTVTTSLSAGRVATVEMTPFPWRQEGNQSIHVPNGFDVGDADLLLDGER